MFLMMTTLFACATTLMSGVTSSRDMLEAERFWNTPRCCVETHFSDNNRPFPWSCTCCSVASWGSVSACLVSTAYQYASGAAVGPYQSCDTRPHAQLGTFVLCWFPHPVAVHTSSEGCCIPEFIPRMHCCMMVCLLPHGVRRKSTPRSNRPSIVFANTEYTKHEKLAAVASYGKIDKLEYQRLMQIVCVAYNTATPCADNGKPRCHSCITYWP